MRRRGALERALPRRAGDDESDAGRPVVRLTRRMDSPERVLGLVGHGLGHAELHQVAHPVGGNAELVTMVIPGHPGQQDHRRLQNFRPSRIHLPRRKQFLNNLGQRFRRNPIEAGHVVVLDHGLHPAHENPLRRSTRPSVPQNSPDAVRSQAVRVFAAESPAGSPSATCGYAGRRLLRLQDVAEVAVHQDDKSVLMASRIQLLRVFQNCRQSPSIREIVKFSRSRPRPSDTARVWGVVPGPGSA